MGVGAQVCIDDLPKAFSRSEGVSALPRMGVYRPNGEGRVVVLDVPVARVKSQLRQVLHHTRRSLLLSQPQSHFAGRAAAHRTWRLC